MGLRYLLCLLMLCNSNFNVSAVSWQPKLLGQVPLKHAAFAEMYFSEDETKEYVDRWSMYISTFDAYPVYDGVYKLDAPGKHLTNVSEMEVELIDKSAYWPNNPDYLPSVIGGAEGVIWSSGFLVPGKKEGKLQMYDTTQDPPAGPFNIASNDEIHWSYHQIKWKDMDADGDLDALTARFHISLLGEMERQLVWFENEGKGFSEGWPAWVIVVDAADISIAVVTLSAGGRDYDCIIASEFFNQRTSIIWTESDTNDWTDLTLVKSRLISEGKQPFEGLIDDFNRDGKVEFMQSEYDTVNLEGEVNIYLIPEDFRSDPFTKKTVATGFVPHQEMQNSMSPGTMKTFYPTDQYASEVAPDGLPHKPGVLVSGDDDGCMYMLVPTSDDREDWSYEKQLIFDTLDTTVGKMVHGDVNGDGFEEIIFACYSIGQLVVYTYNMDL